MIKNFEEFTIDLTPTEHRLIPMMVDRFKMKRGIEHIVTADTMIAKIHETFGVKLKDTRIRKMIQFIRVHNLVPGLIATSRGYYTAETTAEINEWIESLKFLISVDDSVLVLCFIADIYLFYHFVNL